MKPGIGGETTGRTDGWREGDEKGRGRMWLRWSGRRGEQTEVGMQKGKMSFVK